VEDTLENSQRFFYALKLDQPACRLGMSDLITLAKREVTDAAAEEPVKLLSSTYVPDEHYVRDSDFQPGYPVVTFAQILKYGLFPLADILKEILILGQAGMGCAVELEFCVDLSLDPNVKPQFAILQLRPMSAREETTAIDITDQEITGAFCVSMKALGNRINTEISDILFVKPEAFDPARSPDIAMHIGRINALLTKQKRRYLLIGPGRWGSADRWLGIPVSWTDICSAGAIVETAHRRMNADPSQGSHFFHNIISLGINYFTVSNDPGNKLDWDWLISLPAKKETEYVSWISLEHPLIIKVDGRKSQGVVIYEE
jgi:hypothetical protein